MKNRTTEKKIVNSQTIKKYRTYSNQKNGKWKLENIENKKREEFEQRKRGNREIWIHGKYKKI